MARFLACATTANPARPSAIGRYRTVPPSAYRPSYTYLLPLKAGIDHKAQVGQPAVEGRWYRPRILGVGLPIREAATRLLEQAARDRLGQ